MRRTAVLMLLAAGMMSAQTWDALVDSYFDEAVFPFSPTSAVQDGFHAYDAQLEDRISSKDEAFALARQQLGSTPRAV